MRYELIKLLKQVVANLESMKYSRDISPATKEDISYTLYYAKLALDAASKEESSK